MNSNQHSKAQRNLLALLVLGFSIGGIASLGGAIILTLGYQQPAVTQPIWKCGQYTMLLGLSFLAVLAGIVWQTRKLSGKSASISSPNQPLQPPIR